MKQELFNYILSGVRVNKVWPLVLSAKTMEDWMQELCRLYIPRNARSSRIPESSSINRAQKRCCTSRQLLNPYRVHQAYSHKMLKWLNWHFNQNVEMAQLLNIICYITPLVISSQVDFNKLIILISHIWYSLQRLTSSSCTNLGIDVGDLTQNMFFITIYVTRYVTCYVICYVCTLCNMLCNMLCMLCNMLCNTAYSRFTSGAIKSSSTKGRVSSRVQI
jgi:hypothetical protein